ncbi:MAG TPA: trehalose-6-phosphate synthase [Terriglobales bacterium]|nr:trehalose-6-phosphate synthase [Terriglobales bacterium]
MILPKRLIVVSNRLPVSIQAEGDSRAVVPSSGGLVTALTPLVRETGGCWIGWTGTEYDPRVQRRIAETSLDGGGRLLPVFLTSDERKNFYCGFSNEVIWPLFHDLQSCCNFDPVYWDTYCEVNEKFADAVASVAKKEDFVWVHDYHLMLLADCIGEREVRPKLGYFHHIPFPPPDIFEKLPWRTHILLSLLKFSVIGFQTTRDQRNFMQCVRRLLRTAKFQRLGMNQIVIHNGRAAVLGRFPIGIDFEEFAGPAGSPEVQRRSDEVKAGIPGKILLGVDRLDYTKGIPERLRAFRLLLESHHELHGNVSLLQIIVPSREDVPKYRDLKLRIEQLVSQINGAFGRPGWVPIHFLHRNVSRSELIAYYRAADICMVTSLKDGMNLVAKEYCAARVNESGVLILSEFAGAAAELNAGALLVNPYDTEGMMEAIVKAYNMPPLDQMLRMRQMRDVVRSNTVFRWCESFYRATKVKTDETTSTVSESPHVLSFLPSASPTKAWKQAVGSFG